MYLSFSSLAHLSSIPLAHLSNNLSSTVSQKLWQQLYPDLPELFVFSNGWFEGFKKRHCIVRRRITKAATKLPDEVISTVNEFIQFIRRNNRQESFAATILQSSPSKTQSFQRYPTRLIVNLDETPLPFEFLNGYTYEVQGKKTIAGKSERSGWGKRQVTIILYIMANGDTPFKPVVIFHGKGTVASRERYDPRVEVYFNETAYNNEKLFSDWIQQVYIPYIDDKDSMMIMDVATFHKTEGILQLLKTNGILPAMIPPGKLFLYPSNYLTITG
jgi:hypothetical protein